MVKVESKLKLNDFLKLSRTLMFRQTVVILFMIIGAYAITASSAILILFSERFDNTTATYALVFGIFILLVYPVINHFGSKKIFKTHERLKEKIAYEFTEEKIKTTGESFSSEKTWNKIYKVVELKEWVLIYENKLIANVLQKHSFTKEQWHEFKNMVNNKNIKAKWLKNY